MPPRWSSRGNRALSPAKLSGAGRPGNGRCGCRVLPLRRVALEGRSWHHQTLRRRRPPFQQFVPPPGAWLRAVGGLGHLPRRQPVEKPLFAPEQRFVSLAPKADPPLSSQGSWALAYGSTVCVLGTTVFVGEVRGQITSSQGRGRGRMKEGFVSPGGCGPEGATWNSPAVSTPGKRKG